MPKYLEGALRAGFPNICEHNHYITSPYTPRYNCIAFAAGVTDRWWWPTGTPAKTGIYWPKGCKNETTLEAFVDAFATIGYEKCDDGRWEQGLEKIVIYTNIFGIPTHAARQLIENGKWISKLGKSQDIEHFAPMDVGGYWGATNNDDVQHYGAPALYMKRPIQQNDKR